MCSSLRSPLTIAAELETKTINTLYLKQMGTWKGLSNILKAIRDFFQWPKLKTMLPESQRAPAHANTHGHHRLCQPRWGNRCAAVLPPPAQGTRVSK